MSHIKIKISKDGKEYFADGDKVFSWLYERYINAAERKGVSKVVPYKERVQNFFNKRDESWIRELCEAFPGIDIDSELLKARAWLLSNGYKKNLKRFCFNWLAKAKASNVKAPKKKNFRMSTTGRHYVGYCECGKSDFYDMWKADRGLLDTKCCGTELLAERIEKPTKI